MVIVVERSHRYKKYYKTDKPQNQFDRLNYNTLNDYIMGFVKPLKIVPTFLFRPSEHPISLLSQYVS